MTHPHTQPDDVVMASYADLPEAVRNHLASLEIFIGDMDDLELRNGDVIDASVVVPAFNGIVAALRAAAQPAGMREKIIEECAKVCENRIHLDNDAEYGHYAPYNAEAKACAKAIRALALPAERPAVAQGGIGSESKTGPNETKFNPSPD